MTLHSLEIFVAVCECNGVTAAANKLYMAQPAVSLAIKELESSCGTKLFDRISKRLYLTENGKELYNYASHIITLIKEAKEKVASDNKFCTLNVGASITVGIHYMPQIALKMKEISPQSRLRVAVNSSAKIEEMILANRLDFAVIEGDTRSEYIITEPICDDLLVPVFGSGHPFHNMDKIDCDSFFAQDFVLREKNSGTRDKFDNAAEIFGRKIEPLWESTSTAALIHAVILGIGISVLPYRLVEGELKKGTLFTKEVEGLALKRQFSIIIHKNKHRSPAIEQGIELCKFVILKERV